MDRITDDLLVQILHKLPNYKSAVKCMTVSKRWFSLISDPSFIHQTSNIHQCNCDYSHNIYNFSFNLVIQLSYGINTKVIPFKHLNESLEMVIPQNARPELLNFHVNAPDPRRPACVIACCNDLLLCHEFDGSIELPTFYTRKYYIYNLFTKQRVILPPAPPFDSKIGWPMLGLCYAQQRFKVVIIPKYTDIRALSEIILRTFCSKSGKWSKSVVCIPPGHGLYSFFPVGIVAFNGSLHWLVGNLDQDSKIFVYDIFKDAKELRIIDTPRFFRLSRDSCMGVCGGRLRISKVDDFRPHIDPIINSSLMVWELVDYDAGKWILKHKVYLKDTIARFFSPKDEGNQFRCKLKVIAFHPYDENVVYMDIGGRLVFFNMLTKSFRVIGDFERPLRIYSNVLSWGDVFPLMHPCCWQTSTPLLAADA